MKDEIILWRPSDAFRQQSNLHTFEKWLDADRDLRFEDYHALWKWSTTDIVGFWKCIWDYFRIDHDGDLTSIIEGTDMPDVNWFRGVRVNYAEHIFRNKSLERPALMYASEGHAVQPLSWFDLEERVRSLRFFMQKSGVKSGDRVAAYLPNSSEAIVAFLAANSLGAIWSCCSPDFGSKTVIDRFEQIEPVCFIGVDGYAYNGKEHHRLAQTKQIAEALPSVKVKIISKNIGTEEALPGWPILQEIFKLETINLPLQFVRLPFSAPIWILFSSGTTGKPKAITHSQGGVLLEHLKYLHLHNDVHEGEVFFWYTTTGWMMWNFLQASMLVGGVPLLYDGSPGYPDLGTLWKLADDVDLAHFGTSAPFLVACKNKGISPGKDNDLRSLRTIGSTGSPLPAETYDWVYSQVGSHVWLCSMSGGTDVCTAFVGGNPFLPVQRGRIQSRSLGCAMYPYGSDGKRLSEGIGEMIIEQPMPSMPICLWNDPQQKRLRSSYYEDFPGLWRHGDYIQIFDDGSLEILGRSDATLNRKGVRIGTAEIYAVLDSIDGVEDSLILNLERAEGEDFMPLFVKLRPGGVLDVTLVNAIRTSLRTECSPRHVPDLILSVPDIPYTLSGKKMEIPIKKIMLGMSVEESAQKDAVRNPQALEYFRDLTPSFNREHLS